MEVVLVMFKADGAMRSFPLSRNVTVIGRREDCDLRIPLTEVSRKHCRLVKEGETVRVEDLGSSNGTYHNGARIQEAVMQPGDVIQVGPVTFTIQIGGFPATSDIHPPQARPVADDSASGEQAMPAPAANSSGITAAGILSGRPASPEESPGVPADENDSAAGQNLDDILGLSPDKDK
jgi:predicted component of type VI protein secretion system